MNYRLNELKEWLGAAAITGFIVLLSTLLLAGCSGTLIKDLGKDPASACGYSTITYGGFIVAPSPVVPSMGVYVHERFCRSNTPGSTVELKPDGTMSITHGRQN